jgi:hypothetical protein
MLKRRHALTVALAAGLSVPVLAQPIPASIVLKVGDPIGNDGGIVTGVGQPYVNGQNKVGFVVLFSPPTIGRAIWYDGDMVFENFSAPDTPTGSEDTMGVSDAGDWIYSPSVSVDGVNRDSVYTNFGVLQKAGDPLPNNPGFFSTFNSRPRMADDGTAFWIGGYGPASSTTHRAMFRNPNPADPSQTTIVYGTGDIIDGFPLSSSGVSFNYDISPNGLHTIAVVTLQTGSTANDSAVVLDGATIVAQEGSPSGDGDNWQNFGAVGINNSGNWVLAGDTNAATASDGFLVYNGQIAVREGQTLAGVVLSGNPSAVSIDNNNRVLFSWNPTATETVFLAQAPDIAGTARVLLRVGDAVDVDNDGVADYTILDFNASYSLSNAFDLGDFGPIYLNVDMEPVGGGDDFEAIIAIEPGLPPCPADWDGSGTVNSTDISAFLTAWLDSLNNGDLNADFDGSGQVNSTDISAFLTAWLQAVEGGC